MQLKYSRQSSVGSSIIKILIKLLLLLVVFIFAIFLIEKVSFPSPEKKYEIDITNEIKRRIHIKKYFFNLKKIILGYYILKKIKKP